MRKFHTLKVVDKQTETPDSVRLTLQVPDELKQEFDFLPGQHLPIQIEVDGKPVRRTYSICSSPGNGALQLGIRIQPGGVFSAYVANNLKAGDELEVMPPFGQFHANVDPGNRKTYLAFAAGSGITPILSIIRTTLECEPGSRVILFYGNRRQNTTMFIDDLYALKNRFAERLQLNFFFTREDQEFELFSGRLDKQKATALYQLFCKNLEPDEAFVCGPDPMTDTVREALIELGMNADVIHLERYGPPRRKPERASLTAEELDCDVTVIMDGHKKSFRMSSTGTNVVDAAAAQGIELPYSCKGGVCATCRTHVRQGEVRMDTNYGLEPWELEAGYVLACQSHPVSKRLTLDYDKT
ncbi:MAG: FAD-binding oxidoreductase [Woeseiaceae bacterium]|nr:FAD-binding oxidoreductase [Woeseiaceae bacterium]